VTIDRDHLLAKLREQRDRVEREYGLRMVGLIGSVARGEATQESDVDIWVDILRTPTLFQIAHAENELADMIGGDHRVEFVFREDLRPALRARIERDLVHI
jgi:predicted nucleotidyltransferase